MPVRFAPLFALLMLACAPVPETPAREAPITDLADSQGWVFMHNIRFVALAAEDPRDYKLLIACDGPERLRFYHRGLQPEDLTGAPDLTLRSGAATLTVPGERQDDRITPPPDLSAPMDGALIGITIMAVVPREAAVIQRFLETGDLALQSGAHVTNADAASNEAAALAQFWARCT